MYSRNIPMTVQYSQRATFIWPPVIAIYLNVFAENDHRDLCFFADVSGSHQRSIAHGSEHRATRCTNTSDPDGRTRWSLVVINKCIYFVGICNLIYYFQVVVDSALKYQCLFFNYKFIVFSCWDCSCSLQLFFNYYVTFTVNYTCWSVSLHEFFVTINKLYYVRVLNN